jgi:hypothetical protein
MRTEPHLRYVVEKCYRFQPGSEHYEALVEAGIDPNDNWQLVYSFSQEEYANDCCQEEQEQWGRLARYRVRDTGA